MDLPKASVEIRDFPGLATRVDPDDMNPGYAQEQVNVHPVRTGELNARQGYRVIAFEED